MVISITYPMVWTAGNWIGGKSMARIGQKYGAALVWVGCNIGLGATLGSAGIGKAGHLWLEGGVLVCFLKKEGRIGDEKQGQTKPKIWP
jgi:hypothetical protein